MPQLGRGRGLTVGHRETLRRPGSVGGDEPNEANENETKAASPVHGSHAKAIVEKVMEVKSPDDLQVQDIAAQIRDAVTDEDDLKWLVEELCTKSLDQRSCAPVAAKLFGLTAQHQAGDTKIRALLLRRVQTEYAKREELAAADWNHFVNSALFLGELFQHVKTEQNVPIKVLALPVLNYLEMLIAPSLKNCDNSNIDEDMIVVSRQLLQNGVVLHEAAPEVLLEVVQSVTKVLCLCQLSTATRLNLLAGLAALWPLLAPRHDVRTQHALLAAGMGVSLDI